MSVTSKIDQYRGEWRSEVAQCGSLDYSRWLRGLLCNCLHEKDLKRFQTARHTSLSVYLHGRFEPQGLDLCAAIGADSHSFHHPFGYRAFILRAKLLLQFGRCTPSFSPWSTPANARITKTAPARVISLASIRLKFIDISHDQFYSRRLVDG